MVSKYKIFLIALLSLLSLKKTDAQNDMSITVSAGYRAYFSKTSMIDRLTRYSLNYHAYAPGYYSAINLTTKNFFLKPSFSRYGIVHNHGVYNYTIFTYGSPKNRNIRNTNSIVECNLDFGYEFKLNHLVLRAFAGGGWITTSGRDWDTRNEPVPMLVNSPDPIEVSTSLEIFSQSFFTESYTSNFGLGMYIPVCRNLVCELDVCYQTHFNALAANTGTYRTGAAGTPGFGGEFNSILTGAWIFQVGIGYRFN